MKKKGFTLIELLAVIVILAIIALIATPIVMNVIENSKKGAAERSTENYLHAVETAIATERLDGEIIEGEYTIQTDGNLCPVSGCGDEDKYKVNVDMSGNKPSSGNLTIIGGEISDFKNIIIGKFSISKGENGFIIEDADLIIEKIPLNTINLYNKDELKEGYFNRPTEGKDRANSSYIVTGYIPVNPGDTIYYDDFIPETGVWFSSIKAQTGTRYVNFYAKFISAFDSDKTIMTSSGCDNDSSDCSSGTYVVPEGVKYIIMTFPNITQEEHPITNYDNIMISTKPITGYVPYNSEGYYQTYAYLPNKIDVAVGKDLKLYNNNIIPKSFDDSKITFKWKYEIGVEENDGLLIKAKSSDLGEHQVSLLIYYEGKLVDIVSTTINVVDSSIDSQISLLPIGDSLTNSKIWEYHIVDYSEQKLSLVGTKNYTYSGVTMGHEGISGTTPSGYYTAEITANFTNNFYNSEVGHFDYNYYKGQNNINPDGVILFLGTNNLYPYKNEDLESIDDIITEIKNDDTSAEIYLVTPTIRGNQSYFYGAASLYYLKYFEEQYGNDGKIHIVPLVLTVDSYSSFDDGDDIHPNAAGYVEFANTIYSVIAANN